MKNVSFQTSIYNHGNIDDFNLKHNVNMLIFQKTHN